MSFFFLFFIKIKNRRAGKRKGGSWGTKVELSKHRDGIHLSVVPCNPAIYFIFFKLSFYPKRIVCITHSAKLPEKLLPLLSCTLSLKCTRVNPSCLQTWKSNVQPHDGQFKRSENAAETDAFLHMGGKHEGHLAGDVVTRLEEVLGDYSYRLRHEGQSLWIGR